MMIRKNKVPPVLFICCDERSASKWFMTTREIDPDGSLRSFYRKSIEEAKQKAADEFEVRIDQITFRVVNDVKKGLFGKIKEEAKVWAGYNHPVIAEVTVIDSIKAENKLKEQIETCRRYLQNIMEKMGIEAEINIADSEEGFL